MSLHLLIEFGPINWYPHYKNVKKILRKNRIRFKTSKRLFDKKLFDSIWVEEKNIEKARELLSTYNMKDAFEVAREARVEKLSKEFEKNWHWYLIAIFVRYPIAYPWHFLAILIVVLAMIFAPFVKYGIFE